MVRFMNDAAGQDQRAAARGHKRVRTHIGGFQSRRQRNDLEYGSRLEGPGGAQIGARNRVVARLRRQVGIVSRIIRQS